MDMEDYSKAGDGGVDPCSGRVNAGSSMRICSNEPGGQDVGLTGSGMTDSPSRRIETRVAFELETDRQFDGLSSIGVNANPRRRVGDRKRGAPMGGILR